MAEYIERETLLEAFDSADADVYEDYGDGTVDWGFGRKNIRDVISGIPAADVAPVVHCKDCKWFADNNDGEWFGCWLFNAIRAVSEDAPTPDDFCSCGEKMDRGADNGCKEMWSLRKVLRFLCGH